MHSDRGSCAQEEEDDTYTHIVLDNLTYDWLV